MEIVMDRFGRVVIPKTLRERLGLEPGTVLEIELEHGDSLRLRPQRPEPDLVEERGVLVFTGEPAGNLEGAVETLRDARLRHVGTSTEA